MRRSSSTERRDKKRGRKRRKKESKKISRKDIPDRERSTKCGCIYVPSIIKSAKASEEMATAKARRKT
jgi:hypothetical protein